MSMKFSFLLGCLALCAVSFGTLSCDKLGDGGSGKGQLSICFTEGSEILSKAYASIPDTTEFILKVKDSSGKCVYEGTYGNCPEILELTPGNYVVSVLSSEFAKPAFDSPLFGDEQCVSISAGKTTKMHLQCVQQNAGLRLDISQSFKSAYSNAALLLKSSGSSLLYSFSEKRTAYFLPGSLSVVMTRGAEDEVLMVKQLEACNMYTIRISAPVTLEGASGCGLEVVVDTSRVWNHEDLVVGGEASSGGDSADALTVADARNSVGQDDVWVVGYIVGGDLTSAAASFYAPFKSVTNLLLGPRSSVSGREACMAVQLPDNEVREALNLADHPSLLGKRVALKGDIVASYFGLCGIKNTIEYVLF